MFVNDPQVHVYPCVTCVSLLPDCSLKVKDVLREFDADGSLARHRHGEVRGRCVLLFSTIRSLLLQNSLTVMSATRHITKLNYRSHWSSLVRNEHVIYAYYAVINCPTLIN